MKFRSSFKSCRKPVTNSRSARMPLRLVKFQYWTLGRPSPELHRSYWEILRDNPYGT